MNKLTAFFVLFTAIALISCNKDDDSNPVNENPNQPDPSEPNSLTMDQNVETDFLLWAGGIPRNTSNLDVEDFDLINIIESGNLDLVVPSEIIFDQDSVEYIINNTSITREYNFSNDSLFVAGGYFGMGSRYEFRLDRSYIYYSSTFAGEVEQNFNMGLIKFTFENTSHLHGFESMNEMEQTDSVMIYSQTFLYN